MKKNYIFVVVSGYTIVMHALNRQFEHACSLSRDYYSITWASINTVFLRKGYSAHMQSDLCGRYFQLIIITRWQI